MLRGLCHTGIDYLRYYPPNFHISNLSISLTSRPSASLRIDTSLNTVPPPVYQLTRMVSFSVPSNYTFSPSEATPHLTINHDVVADLDSSNAFEGLSPLILIYIMNEKQVLTHCRPREAP